VIIERFFCNIQARAINANVTFGFLISEKLGELEQNKEGLAVRSPCVLRPNDLFSTVLNVVLDENLDVIVFV
jgi:hypothetical protein